MFRRRCELYIFFLYIIAVIFLNRTVVIRVLNSIFSCLLLNVSLLHSKQEVIKYWNYFDASFFLINVIYNISEILKHR